jgi:dTDP-4-amino-4,6-dideoxygalactose transaminase
MAPNPIPVADPRAQFLAHGEAIRSAVNRVLESGRYILGGEVSSFEEEFAAYLGASHCIGVASGTDAVALALRSVGISAGDEVITVSHTAVATVAAIEQIGAVPVFADIDPITRCIDPTAVPALITESTKALVVVHIYGQPAPMREITAIAARHGLKVVEDCAQSHGAAIGNQKIGTFGDAAAFSFYPSKNLGALGDGGAVVTNRSDIAEECRGLRQYGWHERFVSSVRGVNSRLDELQAAILRIKLPFLDKDNARRREIARYYASAATGRGIRVPADIPGSLHAMHLYVVESPERDSLQEFLLKEGVGTARHYPLPVHQQPAYLGRVRGSDTLRVTESLYQNLVSLPMFPELTDEQVETVCSAIKKWTPSQTFDTHL